VAGSTPDPTRKDIEMKELKLSGPWTLPEIEVYLDDVVIPLRLAAISSNGWPVIVSLWFKYHDGTFYCASKKHSRIVELLKNNHQCGFEIAAEKPPYFGVRGQGVARLDIQGGKQWLERLTDRYLGNRNRPFRDWLMRGAADEVVIAIRPLRMMSWDYRKRMTPTEAVS